MTATFAVRALYGPPRPVLVVTVAGEVGPDDHDEFCRQLRRASHVRATVPDDARRRFGCRMLAMTMVVDLRETASLTAEALTHLLRERGEDGRPPRLVVSPGAVRDALTAAGTAELYADVVDAVLRS
ncbi:hypothetical protein [Actinomycetospora atypica]|uniref:STAS domain-containing protein n=1 Tax=Actinomycetospora atypica TaxID=1290095 RepID=A0ABV9YSV4_9PSEU